MKLLVVGSMAYDDVETPAGTRTHQLGGSVTYFSVAASYFTDVAIIGIVGQDFQPEHRELLSSRGIDTSGIEIADGQTFHWAGSYMQDLNDAETVATNLNVFANFNPTVSEQHRSIPYLFLANCDPETQQSVLNQMTDDLQLVAGDTMNHWIIEKREPLDYLMTQLDFSVINEAEARMYTDKSNLVDVAEGLLDEGPDNVIIKRGEYGAVLYNDNQRFIVPAYPVQNIIDPTGAGDSFAGGFMGYIAAISRHDPETYRQAVIAGSVIASFTVEGFGLERLANLTNQEITDRFFEFEDLTTFDTAIRLPLREEDPRISPARGGNVRRTKGT